MLQVLSVVGLLQDETDPMVSVMKVQNNPGLSVNSSYLQMRYDFQLAYCMLLLREWVLRV